MKTHLIVLAGGIGKRMGSKELPKQFLNLGGIPIIVRTLQHAIKSQLFASIYIVIHPDWAKYLQKILLEYGLNMHLFSFVMGGKERIDSIENALYALKQDKVNPQDIVLIHDGVRPFITTDLLKRCIEATQKYLATIAIIPAKDTFISMKNGIATGMIDRNSLFHTQTPAGFQFSIIDNAIKELTLAERYALTGIVQVCQVKDIPVHGYLGAESNFKITTPLDLILGETFLKK